MLAQENYRRTGERHFATSFTMAGLMFLIAIGGIIELLCYILNSCLVRLSYAVCVIWILPVLRFDAYIKGSYALSFIPLSLVVLQSLIYSSLFFLRKRSAVSFLAFFANFCFAVGYVWWIVKLDRLCLFY